jgi:hypothetical protein
MWGHYDSVINYSPTTGEELKKAVALQMAELKKKLSEKISNLAYNYVIWKIYIWIKGINENKLDEANVPGRLYSFLSVKK